MSQTKEMKNNPIHNLTRTQCAAKTRKGTLCKTAPVTGKRRCRMHGGAEGSGAPKGNTNARKHGRYSAESYVTKKLVIEYFKDYKKLKKEMGSVEELTHDQILKKIQSLSLKI